jgi:threonine dehydrogenase-like Zn-dependent dehydrogenase
VKTDGSGYADSDQLARLVLVLAARLHEGDSRLRLEDVAIPTPAPGECLVEVAACGLCGSDLHILDGVTTTSRPLTLGHEAAGTVREVGEDVHGIRAGDRVFIDPIVVCGHCASCRSGRPSICPRRQIVGLNRDGALAEFVAVPFTNLIPIPSELTLEHAAMVESASTPFHALATCAPRFAGDAVAVIGVGGLGFHAVEIANLLGAAVVIAVDIAEVALSRALGHGASHAFDARDPDVGRKVRAVSGGGVAVAVECVGQPSAQRTTFDCLRRGGVAVFVGVGVEPLAGPQTERFVAQEFEARGAFAYSRDEIERVIRLVASGRLDVGAAISERYPLRAVDEAVASFRDRTTNPVRVLVTPHA